VCGGCLNETYSKVRTGEHFYEISPTQNGLTQRHALSRFSTWL
jgi:hypothetical protein